MQLTALYDNGQLTFDSTIQLRQNRLPVVVIIPNHEIIFTSATPAPFAEVSQPVGRPDTRLAQAHQLLGTAYHYVAPAKSDQELLAEALTEKYL